MTHPTTTNLTALTDHGRRVTHLTIAGHLGAVAGWFSLATTPPSAAAAATCTHDVVVDASDSARSRSHPGSTCWSNDELYPTRCIMLSLQEGDMHSYVINGNK